MAQPELNLLAVVSTAVCWCAFAATWLAAENYNLGRAPAERTRSPQLVPGLRLAGRRRIASG